jgi:5-methylcytosine-specific restriction enzyme subunit McrC
LKTVSLFEYNHVPKEELSDEEIKALLSLDPPLIDLDFAKGKIIPQNLVGVVRVGQTTIEILPKIYKEKDITQNRPLVARNLLKMLDYSEFFEFKDFETWADLETIRDFDILEIIVSIFARRLLDTLQSQPHREYTTVEEVLGSVRGRIDFNRYMNPATMHRVPCVYNERTVDNPLNQTLRYVSHLLSGTVAVDTTFSRLRNIVEELDGVSLNPVDVQEVEGIVFNRLNEQYKPYIELCKLFLKDSGVTLQHSGFETFTFVVPMEKLFEKFIATVIDQERGIIPGANIRIQPYIGPIAIRDNGRPLFEMKPDIIVEVGGRRFLVDTKYKIISSLDDIKEGDVYQMYAYANRCGADGVLLLYPNFGSAVASEPFHVRLQVPPGYGRGNIDLYAGKVRFDYDLINQWGDFMTDFTGLIHKALSLP